MFRVMSGAMLLTCAGLVSAEDYAQLENSLDSLLDYEIPAVVTPARVEQPRVEVSSTLSVLTGDFIRRSNVQYVEDLLSYVPGFFVGPYWNSYRKVVAYHGTELDRFRRIQVLVNGRSVYSSAYARVDWSSLALSVEDIERVEVNRGPNASSYGSNSFLAVVNIITRSPVDTIGSDISYTTDDQGNRRVYAQHSGLKDHWSYRVSAAQGTVDGYDLKGDGDPRNDGHTQSSGNMLFVYQDEAQTFDIDIGASHLNADVEFYEIPGVSYGETTPYLIQDREHIKVGWEVDQSPTHTVKLQYYYDRSQQTEIHEIDVYGQVLNVLFAQDLPASEIYSGELVADLDEYRHDIEIQSVWTPDNDVRVVNSASYRQDHVYSKTYFNGDYTEELLRAASNLSYRAWDPIIVNAGLMLEHSKLTGSYTSPQLGLTYKVSEQSSLRMNVSEAYRTPDLLDEKAEWSYIFNGIRSIPAYAQGTAAEKITSYELGWFHNVPSLGMSYDISLYSEHLKNLVASGKKYEDAIEDGGVLTSDESYTATIEGVEVELDWRTVNNALFRATLAYQDTQTDSEKLKETVTPLIATLFASLPLNDTLYLNSRYIYGKEMATYDHEFLSLWLSHRVDTDEISLSTGLGGTVRLDNNPYIRVNNVLTDKTTLFMFANLSF
ncbi:TonB-dependent receptor plug domain-containing protein [Marinomonas ostreistagni]|uniref:TonB-dependent receptor n=1 Tax=Marinomonas ostreistagni TaxID=359209 RepID=A0ABS0ZAJ7_9GAMM|nr:TonB-dependent receptor [Marinomonas ostreistagni]MBJ7550670.1 TonB-dependent receptor [Marinomonas ostreistagni]